MHFGHRFSSETFLNPKPRQTCACRNLSLLECGEPRLLFNNFLSSPLQTGQRWIVKLSGWIVKLPGRIVKLPGRIVKLGL